MCGILGFFTKNQNNSKLSNFENALHSLSHRGPDDFGINKIKLDEGILVLGHRRLSILDLSIAGHQPMISNNGRFVITYNGEIYNFKELKLN